MKCVIITYQSGKTQVYLKSDPALIDEILHSSDWIIEMYEGDFVQPKTIETKGGVMKIGNIVKWAEKNEYKFGVVKHISNETKLCFVRFADGDYEIEEHILEIVIENKGNE